MNCFDNVKKRQADVYVFCLLRHKDKKTINPLDLSQWTFYVVFTQKIEKVFPNIRSLTLSRLKKLNLIVCNFNGIQESVENATS
jgi:hypothetical protein